MKRVLLGAVMWCALVAALAPRAAAQQRPPVQQAADTLSPQQRALLRLRALRGLGEPDTVTVVADSIEPQGIRLNDTGARREVAPPPSQITRDSIMSLLIGVPGYIGTEYAAARAEYAADSSVLVLRGNPQVAREGNQLVADSSIVYNQAQALACGYGSPVLHAVDQSEPLASDTVCFDVERQVGRAVGASTRVQEGATWNVRCDAYFQGDQLYCHDAIFTDCDEPYPHYHYAFGAGELKAVRGNVIVARDVTLRFADVPVFWLPFMVQSLSRGRRSGILMPRFGINDIARTSSRYNRRIEDVGVYWAINDYMGTELAMDWFSDNWTALRGSFDYNWVRQFLRGGFTYRYFWKEDGSTDFTLASNNSWRPDERTNLGLNANFANSTFVRRRTFDPRELNQTIASSAQISRQFDWASASLTMSRNQHLGDNTVQTTMPSVSLNFLTQTLFEADPGEEQWYSNLTWTGNTAFRRNRLSVGAANDNPGARTRQDMTADVGSSIRLGRFGWSQSVDFAEEKFEGRTLPGDTLTLTGSSEQRANWRTVLSFEQRVIGTSTITPNLSLTGSYMRNDSSDQRFVSSPTRINFGSSMRMEIFGFWPGVGPFERFRHRVTPSLSYTYSPAARGDSLQTAIFGATNIAERNQISLGLTQTFEAKYRQRAEARPDSAELTDADSVAADSIRAPARAPSPGDTLGGVRLTRREQVATVSLLAISTEALVYDFVRARTGDGLTNTQLRNSLQSDLLRGLQLSFTHDLFRTDAPVQVEPGKGEWPYPDGNPVAASRRHFAPHLREVNASFSLSANSWLFRVLGLGSRDTIPSDQSADPLQDGDPLQAGPAVDRTESEFGLIGTSRRTAVGSPRGAAGTWNASINYSLFRPRDETRGGSGNQMVTGNVTFQPTENWTVRWNTGYSFTDSEFANHVLTLTRTLHDWDANFDFVKAQNGNFSMQFRVHLRANPDVKLDYSQNDVRGLQTN